MRRHHDRAARRATARSPAPRRATVGGSSEAVGSSSRRIGRGAEQGAGQGDPLPLARAQREAVVAEGGAEPGGQVAQQLGQADGGEHVEQVAVGGVGRAQPQVLRHRRVEEVGPLREPREVRRATRRRSARRRAGRRAPASPRWARRSAAGRPARWTCPIPTGRSAPPVRRAAACEGEGRERRAVAVLVADLEGLDVEPAPGAAERAARRAGRRAGRRPRWAPACRAPRGRAPPPPAPRCWRGTRRPPGAAG